MPLLQEPPPQQVGDLVISTSSSITLSASSHRMQVSSYFPGAAMIRPGVLLRVVANAVLAWLLLAIIWMTLPSPLVKYGPDIYVTNRLKAGKTLIRVYE